MERRLAQPAKGATVPDSLEDQLLLAGRKVWAYSGYPNCYSVCLDALVKLEVEADTIVEFGRDHIGLGCPDDLLDSFQAPKAVGSPEALSILKRGAAFWLPELNMEYTREVRRTLETARPQERRN